jgi:threonyl-tRNA synthetase
MTMHADPVPDEPAPQLPADDHRALIGRLDLCHFQDEAPGMAFWHPRGLTLYRLLEDAARAHVLADGYHEVRTPQVLRRPVWEKSGHWGAFAHAMFALGDGAEEAALKPVSCPGHIQLVRRRAPSWRDLPLRLAEFGLVHRAEASGTMHGLLRLRQFTQDDGHIFCAEAQVADEIDRFCRALPAFYRRFGFAELTVVLSLRPADRVGDDAAWDRAEAELRAVVAGLGVPFEIDPSGGAIYGPKVEIVLRDRRGRAWQCGTIQLDRVMPARFDVRYVDAGGARRHVVMLHRALFGSIERFLGILLEHHAGQLPAWLAPEQVVVLPVAAVQRAAAGELHARLVHAGLRARLGGDDGTLARRVAEVHHASIPYIVVIGGREAADGTAAVRGPGGPWSAPVDAAIAQLVARCAAPR